MEKKTFHILAVDDDSDIIELIKEVVFEIKSARIQITTCDNGQLGYIKAKELLPDLILLDIRMPRWDGYQVFEHLKTNDETSKIPVLFITASINKADIEKARHMGIKHYLGKPFDVNTLSEKIKEILQIKELSSAVPSDPGDVPQ